MASAGLVRAGYTYLDIDDLWAANQRDDAGEITTDPAKFPSGTPTLAGYLKARGMKLGLYTARNVRTCPGRPVGFKRPQCFP
jgi:alpha-galactosidase